MKVPKVSICIPSYNYGNYISQAIESVLNQTFENFELIIVDNNSIDDTDYIVKKIKDKRIRYIKNKQNVGMVKNFNRCVSLAKGKYILILPADDRLLPKMLEKELEIFKKDKKIGLVYSAFTQVDANNNIIKIHKPYNKNYINEGLDEVEKLILGNYIPFSCLIIKKECFDKLGKFDENLVFSFDWDMWIRILLNGFKIGYVSDILAIYRLHEKSETSKLLKDGKIEKDKWNVLEKLFKNENINKKILNKLAGIKFAVIIFNIFKFSLRFDFNKTVYFFNQFKKFLHITQKNINMKIVLYHIINYYLKNLMISKSKT
ncbi:MAG: glycosyltransferase [Candidatus Aenigmatarchaeota archaeon]